MALHQQDRSYRDIAKILDIKRNKVESCIRKAKKKECPAVRLSNKPYPDSQEGGREALFQSSEVGEKRQIHDLVSEFEIRG